MKRKIIKILLIMVSCATASASNGGSLDSMIEEALSSNLALKAAKFRWESMQERQTIAGALPDPTITYGYFFHSVETRVGPMDQRFVGSQKFPFPGKRSLAAARAESDAIVAMWEYQTQERSLILNVKLAYHELQQVAGLRKIFQDEITLLESILEAARARYESAAGEQQAVLKANLAASEVRQRLLDLDRQERTFLARLNALSNNAPARPVSVAQHFERPALPTESDAIAVADVYRQELQAAGVAIERDEFGVSLAEKNRWPDFSVGIEYIDIGNSIVPGAPGSGDDSLMGFISFNLPLWRGKLRAEQAEAEKRLAASRETASDLRAEIMAEVHTAWFHARIREEQIKLYASDLIPLAEQSLESAQAGYRAARVGFLDVLDSERVLFALRVGMVIAETDYAKSLARLERSVGVDLDRIPQLTPAEESTGAMEAKE